MNVVGFGIRRLAVSVVAVAAVAGALAGCSRNQPTLIRSPHPELRKTSTELAADAAKRHPFQADLPSGGQAAARAEANYGLDVINLVNLSDEPWQNVEMWVNRQYVILLPEAAPGVQKMVNFEMLFNDKGEHFPLANRAGDTLVQRVEIIRDGKIYEIPTRLAD